MGGGSLLPAGQRAMLGASALAALVSLIGSPYPDLAPLQNLPTLAVLAASVPLLRRWPLPDAAIACLCGFLLLHTLGGRYAYSNVPYDEWLEAIGWPGVRQTSGPTRNGYDRLVHLAFGLLMVHPLVSGLIRHRRVGRGAALIVAVNAVLAASAVYEIFEWLLTRLMAGPDAAAYNGQQGDIWDAQKDMACAGVGSVISTIALWRFSGRYSGPGGDRRSARR